MATLILTGNYGNPENQISHMYLFEQESDFKAKREAVKRLEYDVNVIEKEGRKLHKEYEKVMKIDIPEEGATSEGLRDEQEIYTELKVGLF